MSIDDRQKSKQQKSSVPLLSEPRASLLLQQQAQKQLRVQLIGEPQARSSSGGSITIPARIVVPSTASSPGRPTTLAINTVMPVSASGSASGLKNKPKLLGLGAGKPVAQKPKGQAAQATIMPHAVKPLKVAPKLKPPPPYPTDIGPPNPLYGPLLETAEALLTEHGKPLHLQEIKCKMLEKNLLDVSTIALLDAAIMREVQLGSHRFRKVDGQPGYYALTTVPIPILPNSGPASVSNAVTNHVGTSQPHGQKAADRDYKKYRKLKKFIKQTVFLNASLCDEVLRVEEKLAHYKEERRFLLRRVLQHDMLQSARRPQASPATSQTAALKKLVSSLQPAVTAASHPAEPPVPMKAAPNVVKKEKPKKRPSTNATASVHKPKTTKELLDQLKAAKPKKSAKAAKRTVHLIPLDQTGRPIFPILLGGLTIHSLGEIISDRPSFHSPETIFPVGFCSTRIYASVKNPDHKCLYTCKILDGGQGPVFEMSPEDDPKHVLTGTSASECHSKLLQLVNKARGADVIDVRGKGVDFFGLSHPTVQNLIQSSPGARKCSSYRWVKYEVIKSEGNSENQYQPMDSDVTINFDALHMNPAFKAAAASQKAGTMTPSMSNTSLRSLLTSGPMKSEPS